MIRGDGTCNCICVEGGRTCPHRLPEENVAMDDGTITVSGGGDLCAWNMTMWMAELAEAELRLRYGINHGVLNEIKINVGIRRKTKWRGAMCSQYEIKGWRQVDPRLGRDWRTI